MANSPDSAVIGIRCPHCANQDQRPLSWLRERAHTSCPACGATIAINQEKLTAFLHKPAQKAPQPAGQMAWAAIAVIAIGVPTLAWLGERYGTAPRSPSAPDAAFTQAVRLPPQPAAPVVPTCAAPPQNGTVLGVGFAIGGPGTIEIENGTSSDAIVKMRFAINGRLALSFFVAAISSVSYRLLPAGSYLTQFATGVLAKDCRSFARAVMVSAYDTMDTFGPGQLAGVTYTLQRVAGGNVSTHTISLEDFNAP